MAKRQICVSCKSCWWQEGDRCYVGKPERLPDGRSTKLATKPCGEYWNKREALGTVIPGDMLIISSEENELKDR